MNPKAVICDLDGCLALYKGDAYNRDFESDTVNEVVATILQAAYKDGLCPILIVSGRSNKYRYETLRWLVNNNIPCSLLFLRPEDDSRPSHELKQEVYDQSIKDKYDVFFVLEDRTQDVVMWRKNKLVCFQTAYGDF